MQQRPNQHFVSFKNVYFHSYFPHCHIISGFTKANIALNDIYHKKNNCS